MHLLARFSPQSCPVWKAAFDADHGPQGAAGLNPLQLWREDGHAPRPWLLFQVRDRKTAAAFLNAPTATPHARRAGPRNAEYHFPQTA